MLKVLETYPVEVGQSFRRAVFWLAGLMLACVAATAVLVAIDADRWAAVSGAVFLFLLFLFVNEFRAAGELPFWPYFDKKMSKSEWLGFEHGKNLARNSRPLDVLARDFGAKPLSDFGFADDLVGGTVTWHDPTIGIAAIDRLIAIIDADAERPARELHSVEEVKQSLYALRSRLEIAASCKARFALILKGNSISGLEVERRKGFF